MPLTLDVSSTENAVRVEATEIDLIAMADQIVVEITENGLTTEFRADSIQLGVESVVIAPVVEATEIQVIEVAEQGPRGVQGTSGTVAVDESLVAMEWGTPAAESGDAIEITGALKTFTGDAFVSSVVDVQVVVTDSATDAEPSATATLSAASTPVGTVLAGSGTATMTIRTNAGQLAIRVTEPNAAHRYLWLRNGGHARLWIRSLTGVQELVFA